MSVNHMYRATALLSTRSGSVAVSVLQHCFGAVAIFFASIIVYKGKQLSKNAKNESLRSCNCREVDRLCRQRSVEK